jgi:hypothetical protein
MDSLINDFLLGLGEASGRTGCQKISKIFFAFDFDDRYPGAAILPRFPKEYLVISDELRYIKKRSLQKACPSEGLSYLISVTVFFLCWLSFHFCRNASNLLCVTNVLVQSVWSPVHPSSIAVFHYRLCLIRIHSLHARNCLQCTTSLWPLLVFPTFTTFPPMLVLPYETTMVGKPPIHVGPSGSIPMQPLASDVENFAYLDPATNSERLPRRLGIYHLPPRPNLLPSWNTLCPIAISSRGLGRWSA